MELAQDELGKAADAGARIVALDDPGYPAQLKQIYDPPLILYVRGNDEVITHPGIALVGTRHPTPYGSGMAERLACDLAARGLVIFSGMARGIDTAGHRGAIAAKGKVDLNGQAKLDAKEEEFEDLFGWIKREWLEAWKWGKRSRCPFPSIAQHAFQAEGALTARVGVDRRRVPMREIEIS